MEAWERKDHACAPKLQPGVLYREDETHRNSIYNAAFAQYSLNRHWEHPAGDEGEWP